MVIVQSISPKVVCGRRFSAKVFRPKSLSSKKFFGQIFSIRYKSIAVIFAVKNGSFATEILLDPESYQLRKTSLSDIDSIY